jgi:hypothetical protein
MEFIKKELITMSKIRKLIAILFVVLFVVTVTAGAVSAILPKNTQTSNPIHVFSSKLNGYSTSHAGQMDAMVASPTRSRVKGVSISALSPKKE